MSKIDHRHRRLGVAAALISCVAAIGAAIIGDDALAGAPPTYSFSQGCSEADELPVITNTGTGLITAYSGMNVSVLSPGGSSVIGYYDPSNPDPADVMWFVGAGGYSENPTIIGSGNFAVCLGGGGTTTTTAPATTTTTTAPATTTTAPATTTTTSDSSTSTTTTTEPGAPASTTTTEPGTAATTTEPGTAEPPEPPSPTEPTGTPAAPAPAAPGAAISDSSPAAGDDVTVTATGFDPGESVTAVLHSTPRTLGTVSADAEGRVTITFEILASDSPGAHRVVFTGPTTGSVSIGLTIAAAQTLPATGSDVSTALVLALLLVACGTAISRCGRAGG